jgi:predicted AAA+ superfamily ATPase
MTLAHTRKRQALNLLLKKMRFSPIVSIQGARQVGKSFLAKKLLPEKLSSVEYLTLDHKDIRSFAENNPNTFLKNSNAKHLVIDEVQKVPDLFDEMKAIVDDQRSPGQYLILGSTEFSHETQIKESLTGRLSRIRLFPLNLAETKKLDLNKVAKFPFINDKCRVVRNDLMKYLKHGGFPGIFIVKDETERRSLFEDWLNLTTERDIHQLKKYKLDSDIALQILRAIARLDNPTLVQISREVRASTKKILNHLSALKKLFVIFDVTPIKGSSGKAQYYLTDVGLLDFFNSTFEKRLTTWLYLEFAAQLSYKGHGQIQFHYYKHRASSSIHLICSVNNINYAIKLIFSEGFDKRDYLVFDAFKKKFKDVHCYAFYGGNQKLQHNGILIYPWEAVV